MPEDEYVCKLNDYSLEKAKNELNEDPKERLGALEAFRKWVLEQPHLKCPTDDIFLLAFLRTAKWSQLKARTILTGHLTCKVDFPKWYDEIDTACPRIQKFFDSEYMCVLPGRDPEGRVIIVSQEGNLDPKLKNYDINDVMKAMWAVTYYYMRDENVHVNGFVFFSDYTHFSVTHMNVFSMEDMRNMMHCFQGNSAGRFKAFHCYNHGAVFEAFMTLFKPLLSKKYRDRMVLHGSNMEHVYKSIPKHMWPVEYLPDDYTGPNAGTFKSLVEDLKKTLLEPEIKERIAYESRKEWGIDKSKIPKDVQFASFRKLNVD